MRPNVAVAGFVVAGFVVAVVAAPTASRGAAQLPSPVLSQTRLEVDGPFGARESVLVTVPRLSGRRAHPEGHRWPVVVALHGLGEAEKGPERGYLGWSVDYALPRVYEAMLWGTLIGENFRGFVRREHLRRVNAWLRETRFEGVAVVTPYTPALLAPGRRGDLERYGDWLADDLLRQVRAAHPELSRTRDGTGIDGVSLGGRIALEVGLRHPEAFRAVGGIQPAVRGDAAMLTALARPEAAQRLRLLSSDEDPFLGATRELSGALAAASVPHDLVVVPGPHDYGFNRGPGGIELLRFAAMALVPEPVGDAP